MIFTKDEINKIQSIVEQKSFNELKFFENNSIREINSRQNYRSILMLSSDNLKHLNKINDVQADAVILNLEDGVSQQNKPLALHLCGLFLSKVQKSNKKMIVRVNALCDGAREEIEFLNSYKPDAIRIPKVETVEDVQIALELIDEDIEVHLSIETAKAWLNLKDLKVNSRVKTVYLGILDLFADMNLPHELISPENPLITELLSNFLLTSSALHLKPVSFVYQDYKNEKDFKLYLELEKSLGYQAKACLSPSQVAIVNQFFSTDNEAIKRAKIIVKEFKKHQELSIGGFTHEKYGFIDEPIYKAALNIIENE